MSSWALNATTIVDRLISDGPDRGGEDHAPGSEHAGRQRDRERVVAGGPDEVLDHLRGRWRARAAARSTRRGGRRSPARRRPTRSRRPCPAPIAMPTSARASAGASFTPSPTIATRRPRAWSSATTDSLCSGSTSAMHLVDAEVASHRLGDLACVAGDHHDAATRLVVQIGDRLRRLRADRGPRARARPPVSRHAARRGRRPRGPATRRPAPRRPRATSRSSSRSRAGPPTAISAPRHVALGRRDRSIDRKPDARGTSRPRRRASVDDRAGQRVFAVRL